MDLSTFLQVIKATRTIEAIIQEQLGEILRQIGDSQLEAAIRSIEDMKFSNNPTQEAGYAISNLQSAHTLLQKSVEKLPHIPLVGDVAFVGYDERASKVIEVSFLIAACYAYQRNTQLVVRYADQTRQEFAVFAEKLTQMSGPRIILNRAGQVASYGMGLLAAFSGGPARTSQMAGSLQSTQSLDREIKQIEARVARLPDDKQVLEEQLSRLVNQ